MQAEVESGIYLQHTKSAALFGRTSWTSLRPVLIIALWCPLLPYGYSYKASCARPGYAIICNFWTSGHWRSAVSVRVPGCQKLTRSGTGCFIAVPIWQQWASKGYKCWICVSLCWCAGYCCWEWLSWRGTHIHQQTSVAHRSTSAISYCSSRCGSVLRPLWRRRLLSQWNRRKRPSDDIDHWCWHVTD